MRRQYPHLLAPMTIRGKRFRNRILFSAHSHPQCRENHMINEEGIAYYAARARGGAAQVTFGETPVDSVHAYKGALEEHLLINVPMTFGYMSNMAKFPTVIHSNGALASIQLCHAGQAASNPIGPSAVVRKDGVAVREMSEEDIQDVVDAFANAARMAKVIGFDGVQIHGGHGWLLAQFTSPLTNKRTDRFGGSLENRLRFPIMVLKAVRAAIGQDSLIEYRISGDELVEGGYHEAEAQQICRLLEPYVDLFQVSVGVYTEGPGNRMFPSIYNKHCCNAYLAANIKKAVNTPVIAVGSIMTPEEAEEIIASGQADFVAMAREMLAEPDFARKAAQGRAEDIIPCIRCFGCMAGEYGPPFSLECSVNPYAGKEDWLDPEIPKALPRKVVVVGGGPAGMEAALCADKAGHQVVLYEKAEKLGGALWFTETDCHKSDLKRFKDYLVTQVKKSNILVHTGTEAAEEILRGEQADVIICATGANAVIPRIPGIKYASHALRAYERPEELGKRVVMIGGGLIGCETGLHLAATGHEVTVVELQREVARDGYGVHVANMMLELRKQEVRLLTETACKEVRPGAVRLVHSDGTESTLECDTVLYAVGMKPTTALADRLVDCAPLVVPVGDCLKAGKVRDAVHSAYFAVRNL